MTVDAEAREVSALPESELMGSSKLMKRQIQVVASFGNKMNVMRWIWRKIGAGNTKSTAADGFSFLLSLSRLVSVY